MLRIANDETYRLYHTKKESAEHFLYLSSHEILVLCELAEFLSKVIEALEDI